MYTYRRLKEALSELSEEQLDMAVVVSSRCDADGEAEFFSVDTTTFAGNPDVNSSAGGVFDDDQPIILFAEEIGDY